MYLQHFGLKHNPLGKRSKLLDTTQYGELEKQLQWLLECRGIGLVTGVAGIGKTRAIAHWCETLNPAIYEVIYQSDNHFRPFDIYCQLSEALGLESQHRYCRLWRVLKSELLRRFEDKKENVVWVLDEAQQLPSKFLAELPAFLNYSFDSKKVVTIVLIGNPQLEALMKKKLYEPLASRISFHCQWHALESIEQFGEFIQSAFQEAGLQKSIISSTGLQLIHMASQGRLRYADRVITRALQIACSQNISFISDEIIKEAISQLRIAAK